MEKNRATASEFEALGSGELIVGNAAVSGNSNVIDQRLRAFFDFKCYLDFGFAVDDLGSDLDLFVSPVPVKGLQIIHALFSSFWLTLPCDQM